MNSTVFDILAGPPNKGRLFFILGPCVIESYSHCIATARRIRDIANRLEIAVVFKASFDKANRTSIRSFRGASFDEAMRALGDVRTEIGLPTITDVHQPEQCPQVAPFVDFLQIPAFLCRQTDLLVAASRTGRFVNIKKGQFMSAREMRWAVEKVVEGGPGRPMLCERGTFFGYNDLVNDFRGIKIMADENQCPVVFDATHSVQQPGANAGASGGDRSAVWALARAATAVGVAGLFFEAHEDPDSAPSDSANMVPLDELETNLARLVELDALTKRQLQDDDGIR